MSLIVQPADQEDAEEILHLMYREGWVDYNLADLDYIFNQRTKP